MFKNRGPVHLIHQWIEPAESIVNVVHPLVSALLQAVQDDLSQGLKVFTDCQIASMGRKSCALQFCLPGIGVLFYVLKPRVFDVWIDSDIPLFDIED